MTNLNSFFRSFRSLSLSVVLLAFCLPLNTFYSPTVQAAGGDTIPIELATSLGWQRSGFTLGLPAQAANTPPGESLTSTIFVQAVRGTDNVVYTRRASDPEVWTGWIGNGSTISEPSLIFTDNKFLLTIRGTDNQVYTRTSQDGITWTNWVGAGVTTATTPTTLYIQNSNLSYEVVQTIAEINGTIKIRKSLDGGTTWLAWNNIPGAALGSPAILQKTLTTMDGTISFFYIAVRGTDNGLYLASSLDNGNSFQGWVRNGSALQLPVASEDPLFQRGFFVTGTDSNLYFFGINQNLPLNQLGWSGVTDSNNQPVQVAYTPISHSTNMLSYTKPNGALTVSAYETNLNGTASIFAPVINDGFGLSSIRSTQFTSRVGIVEYVQVVRGIDNGIYTRLVYNQFR